MIEVEVSIIRKRGIGRRNLANLLRDSCGRGPSGTFWLRIDNFLVFDGPLRSPDTPEGSGKLTEVSECGKFSLAAACVRLVVEFST